jgi:hypothetical protein
MLIQITNRTNKYNFINSQNCHTVYLTIRPYLISTNPSPSLILTQSLSHLLSHPRPFSHHLSLLCPHVMRWDLPLIASGDRSLYSIFLPLSPFPLSPEISSLSVSLTLSRSKALT